MRGFADFVRGLFVICIVLALIVIVTNWQTILSSVIGIVGAVVSAAMPCVIMAAGIVLMIKAVF